MLGREQVVARLELLVVGRGSEAKSSGGSPELERGSPWSRTEHSGRSPFWKAMLMLRETVIHCFMHAAALASNLWLDLLAVPENASTSKVSRPKKPRSTKRSRM
eukprot:1508382-Pyramimonas_sp.AAC.1